jgi:putative phosphoesterase
MVRATYYERRKPAVTRIALFSDIHGNLPALEAVLADIARQANVDRTYCLGDLVGYAPFPNEVIDRIAGLGVPTLMGNYDDGVGFERDDCGCAYTTPADKARGDLSLAWTKAHVTPERAAFLRTLLPELRITLDGQRILLVHGSPRRINEYLYADRPLASFRRLAASANADVIAFGHTHIPYTKLVDDVLFVNIGSVGKPKDGDPRACYAILNERHGAVDVEFRRVPYDVATVAAAIRASDLPDAFAAMLEEGRG